MAHAHAKREHFRSTPKTFRGLRVGSKNKQAQPVSNSSLSTWEADSYPTPRVCLIVRTRPYDEEAVLRAVLQRGYSPVERSGEGVDAVIATVTPEVAVMVVDPSREHDRNLISRVASTGAFVIFIAPSHEFFAIGLAAGADVCLEDSAVDSALSAQLASVARRRRDKRPVHVPGGVPLGEDAVLDVHARRIVTADRAMALTPFEFGLLDVLTRNAGRIVSAPDLVAEVKGHPVERARAAATVKTYMVRLRRKFASAGIDPGLLRTVRGGGYVLDSPWN